MSATSTQPAPLSAPNKLGTRPKRKLRNRFIRTFFFAVVLPFVIVGVSGITIINRTNRRNVDVLEQQLIRLRSAEIARHLEEVVGALEVQVPIKGRQDIERREVQELIQAILKNKAFISLRYVNHLGRETARIDRFDPAAEPRIFFDWREDPLVAKALAGARAHGNTIFTLDGPALEVAAPVTNAEEQYIGAFVGYISLKEILSIIEKGPQLQETGYMYAVDQRGTIVAHSLDPSRVGRPAGFPFSGYRAEGEAFACRPYQGRYESEDRGIVIGSTECSPLLNAALVVEWPVEEAEAIVRTLSGQFAVIGIAVLALSLLLAIRLGRHVVRPIQQLEFETAHVAEGKFDHPINIQSGDELEALGMAFNSMARSVQELIELKDEFAFVAAHELRTPVTAIKGFISLLLEGGSLTAQQRHFLQRVQQSNEQLVSLVDDLLNIARSQAGRLEFKVAPLQITRAVEEVIQSLAPLADKSKVHIQYEKVEGVPRILADQDRLREVLVNLIGNAIKYNKEGGRVSIRHRTQRRSLITEIEDTGIGIKPEEMKKLFEKFYRAPGAIERKISGTGLGLFIVRQLIERMGGSITAESKEGKGTVMRFTLPLAP